MLQALGRTTIFERGVATVVLAGAALEAVLSSTPWAWLAVPAVGIVIGAALPWRRRPAVAAAAYVVTNTAMTLAEHRLGPSWVALGPTLGAVVLLYSIGRFPPFRAGVGWLTLVAAAAAATELLAGQPGDAVAEIAGVALVGGIGLNEGERVRRNDAAHQRQQNEERERIARDLHDVIAHGVAAIALQADAAAGIAMTDPDTAKAALERIRDTARHSLGDLRHVIGILRHDDVMATSPAPDLTQLAVLARVDTPTVVIDTPPPPQLHDLPTPVSRALFRVAQEAVTNALRHAEQPTTVTVRVTRSPDQVDLDVADDGHPPGPQRDGYGITGMRERTTLLGGTLQAGADPYGGWRVHATVPLPEQPA